MKILPEGATLLHVNEQRNIHNEMVVFRNISKVSKKYITGLWYVADPTQFRDVVKVTERENFCPSETLV
jgi:hypothetical protein